MPDMLPAECLEHAFAERPSNEQAFDPTYSRNNIGPQTLA